MFDALTADALLGALLIFSLRIVDVSLGTLRIGMLIRGKRTLAGVLSFFESLIWLLAAAKVLSTLDSPLQFVAYAGGYAAGTMLGANIERWLAVGKVVLRIIVPVSAPDVQEALRKAGFYVTTVNASGRDGEVRIMFSVIARKKMKQAIRAIESVYPKAFVTVEEVTTAQLQDTVTHQEGQLFRRLRMMRK
ncbi:DUF2179 domain-containing protein [Deinococcus arenicola]|uniref:UPF0316 protein ORD21_04145 n=1 Tax=Deinococcus arenicola TaxID=2994950 RepID=A0ABU4DMX6_9DEIO|nr:DUF5698 domain-containing protein [Deinococcus sp. ZS9-10]MDV6373787.1 DUF5698 domain-containing protein [Deinococcus sp. ZS9-10]